jgi:hypothetical protein
MGKSLWLLASVLVNSYGTMVTQLTNLMTLCPTKSLVYGDTSSLILNNAHCSNDNQRKKLSQDYVEDPSQVNKPSREEATGGFQPT